MSAHTPGPWVVRRDEWDGFCVHAPTIESQAGCLYRIVRGVNGDETPNPTYGTPEANARLISAAPELLDALHAFANATLTYNGHVIGLMREDFERARAAITKATGEQP